MNKDFQHLGHDEIDVLNACTNAALSMSEGGSEEMSMCKALEDIKAEGREQGLAEGRALAEAEAEKNDWQI